MNSLTRLTENQDNDWVYWMEGEYRSPNTSKEKLIISLHASLVDVAETLKEQFFKRFDYCLLTSATLKVNNSFSYFVRRIGLEDSDKVITKEFLSPFLYNEQVTYHQYGGAREISTDPTMIGELVYHLHKTLGKRTMVLFTSRKALTDTANYLKEKPGGRDLPYSLSPAVHQDLELLKECISIQMEFYLEQTVFGKGSIFQVTF